MCPALRKSFHIGWCVYFVGIGVLGWRVRGLHPRRVTTVTRCSLPPSGLGQVGRHGDWVVTDFVTSPLGHHDWVSLKNTCIRRHAWNALTCTWHGYWMCITEAHKVTEICWHKPFILHAYMYSMRSTHTYSMHTWRQTHLTCVYLCEHIRVTVDIKLKIGFQKQ